jgi:hypothetical protein
MLKIGIKFQRYVHFILYAILVLYEGHVFWEATPCSLVGRWKCFRGSYYLRAACSSETLLPINQTTWCLIQEDHDLNSHCSENLRFDMLTYMTKSCHYHHELVSTLYTLSYLFIWYYWPSYNIKSRTSLKVSKLQFISSIQKQCYPFIKQILLS